MGGGFMIIYTAEREIDIETHDLLGPELTLAKAQYLCQKLEDVFRYGKTLDWHESADGLSWTACGASGTFYVTKWEVDE
jgi:hypothetical protein